MPPEQRGLILVTGATGYIGRALVARLLAESMPVRVLVRAARRNDIRPGYIPAHRRLRLLQAAIQSGGRFGRLGVQHCPRRAAAWNDDTAWSGCFVALRPNGR